jgi:TonB family protein
MHTHSARLSRRGVALWMLCGFASQAMAWAADSADLPFSGDMRSASPAANTTDQLFDFDIPAQALDTALQRYGSLSRQPALYRAEIVNGQTATAVRGRYTPEAALRLLLEGTGLTAEKFDTGAGSAFILKMADNPAATAGARSPGLGSLNGYPGRVQARVWQALCSDPRTVPGGYRSLLRFQVDAAGQVQRARLIGSSGNARRDAALLAALQGVRMDGAPPPDMPQPVTMLLLPHDAGFGLRCEPESTPKTSAGRPDHG